MKALDLIAAVADRFDLTSADLIGRSRMRVVVEARQAAAWVLRRAYPSLALADIGHLLDRDHTTIIYSISQIEKRIAGDPVLRAELHSLLPQKPLATSVRARPDHAGSAWWVAQSRDSYFVRAA